MIKTMIYPIIYIYNGFVGAIRRKKRARKAYPELGVVRWNKGNNEYLIE